MLHDYAPKHVGIIMDGNRRFAKRLMKEPWKGHDWGAAKVEKMLDWCLDLGIRYVTLYSLSIENLNRPKRELDMLMSLFEKNFRRVKTLPKIHENKVKVIATGRIDLLPKKVQDAIKDAMDSTKDYSDYTINFAMAYGGRREIIDMTKRISGLVEKGIIKKEDIDEKTISQNLYAGDIPDPDLIIRTSGEKRISGFLLWQGAYSELYFSRKMWPEFNKRDFLRAVNSFSERQRRFGV